MRSWASEGRWKRRWTRCWIEWRERGASVRAPSAPSPQLSLGGFWPSPLSTTPPTIHIQGQGPTPTTLLPPILAHHTAPIIWLVDGLDFIWISVSFFLGRSGPSLPADLLNPAHPLNWFFFCRSDEISPI